MMSDDDDAVLGAAFAEVQLEKAQRRVDNSRPRSATGATLAAAANATAASTQREASASGKAG